MSQFTIADSIMFSSMFLGGVYLIDSSNKENTIDTTVLRNTGIYVICMMTITRLVMACRD